MPGQFTTTRSKSEDAVRFDRPKGEKIAIKTKFRQRNTYQLFFKAKTMHLSDEKEIANIAQFFYEWVRLFSN